MPPWRGISQMRSLTRRSSIIPSDVENHAGRPAAVALLDGELVIGDGLDQTVEPVARAVNALPRGLATDRARVDDFHGELAGDEPRGLDANEEVAQEIVQKLFPPLGLDGDADPLAGLHGGEVHHEPQHGEPRALEQLCERRGVDLEPDVGGVLDFADRREAVLGAGHHFPRVASKRRRRNGRGPRPQAISPACRAATRASMASTRRIASRTSTANARRPSATSGPPGPARPRLRARLSALAKSTFETDSGLAMRRCRAYCLPSAMQAVRKAPSSTGADAARCSRASLTTPHASRN